MRSVVYPAVIGLAILAAPAQAVTFFSLGGIGSGPAAFETTLVDFDTPLPADVFETNAGTVGIFTTSSSSAAAPAGDTTAFMGIGSGGSATFDLRTYFASQSTAIRSISVYVGSVDTFNHIEVLDLNLHVIATINGVDLPEDDGDQGDMNTNRRVYINFLPSESVGGLRFLSGGTAFEFDDIAVSSKIFHNHGNPTPPTMPPTSDVPEPATWTTLIAGMTLVGIAMRRRRNASVRSA